MKAQISAAVLSAFIATSAAADEFTPAMQEFYANSIASWVNSPVLIDAINNQNSRTVGLVQEDIDSLDRAWRAEVGSSETPTITPVLTNSAAGIPAGNGGFFRGTHHGNLHHGCPRSECRRKRCHVGLLAR